MEPKERIEQLALEHLERTGELPSPSELAQWLVEEHAARGEYSGLVDDGDAVRDYGKDGMSNTAMELDFTQNFAWAVEVLGGQR